MGRFIGFYQLTLVQTIPIKVIVLLLSIICLFTLGASAHTCAGIKSVYTHTHSVFGGWF